jgi:hypothetical protein
MEFTIRVDFGTVAGVFCALVLIGVGYNQAIAWAERRGYIEGFTSLAVALGTLLTLAGVAVICWQAALMALGCFAASGFPMILGSIGRYARARELARENIIQEATHGDQPERLAQ